ncbi:glycosyltransferase [Paenibacillus sp. GCM10027629]|uniref:CgeB family protein n=1 Tax=Paenibacillus sp. GCM10027629 TaxID=3273414 RepID=UPI00364572FA
MNNVGVLKSEIIGFQKKILNDLKPFVFNSKVDFNVQNWYVSSDNVLLENHNDKMIISYENTKNEYISYKENNNSFVQLPKTDLLVLPDETFEITFTGDEFKNIKIHLAIIEYSHVKKIKQYLIELNQSTMIHTSPSTEKVRIAIRVSGKGLAVIDKLQVTRKLMEENNKIVFPSKLPEIKKNNVINNLSELKIACIFDEFTISCYEKVANLISFTPDNWETVLEEKVPDILFVESAWKGNFGSWQYKIAKYNNQDKEPLNNLIAWCNHREIPTIFWNKEDPIHFEKFIDSAKMFDYIYTTDEDMIGEYLKYVKHDRVYALSFSAEPSLHNPIRYSTGRSNKISFAGSYYSNRHKDRQSDMDELLEVASEYGLEIYDRNFDENKGRTTQFSYPPQFRDNIVGKLKYDEIAKAYKGYKVMLNVNSVKNSPTMFSRRVFEGLASGTPIVSTYSKGINMLFKNIVLSTDNKEELNNHIQNLMNDEDFYRNISLAGIREVYMNHMYKHRLQYIINKLGVKINIDYPNVSVVSIVNSKDEFQRVLHYFNQQTWKRKNLVVFLKGFDGYIELLNNYNVGNINSYVYSYINQYSRISEIIQDEYIAFLNPNDFYGENYMLDLAIAIEYSKADIVGKGNVFAYDKKTNNIEESGQENEYTYVSQLFFSSSVASVDIFNGENIVSVLQKMENNELMTDYFKKGARLFSSDKYNYVKLGDNIVLEKYNKIER